MRSMRILGGFVAAATLVAAALVGCGGGRARPITIKGSDTMVLLGQRWAEDYMAKHAGSIVQVTGGGSGTGFAALINGTTDVCQASRPIKDEEKEQLQAKYGSPGHEILVAKDGIAIYVHDSNPISEISLDQLHAIYTGAVTRWSAVGGPDKPITLYGRENSSGTYEYYKEHVLKGADFAAAVQTLPGTAAVVNAVSKDPNGIGYGGAAYAKGVKALAVRSAAGAVPPDSAHVVDGSYPISRGLFFYARRPPEGAVKAFVDFVLSVEGQRIVSAVGYYPIR